MLRSLVNVLNVLIASIAPSASYAGAQAPTTPVRTDLRGVGSERFGAGKHALLCVSRGRKGVAGTMADTLGTIAVYGADLPNPLSGVPLGNAFAASTTPTSELITGDGSKTQFQTSIPYAAFSNYNWVVEMPSFKLTGTVTVAAGVVTGSSTDFDPEVDVGDLLMLGGQLCTVTARTSDTAAVVSPAITVAGGATGYNLSQSKAIKSYLASVSGPQTFAVTNVGGFARIDFAVAPPAASSVAVPGAQSPGAGAVYLVTPVQVLADGAHINERTSVRTRTVMWAVATGDGGDDFDGTVVSLEAQTAS